MRVLILGLTLTSATVLGLAADKEPFSGKWQVQQSIAGNESTQTCTFTQAGSDLSGTCAGEQGQVKVTGKAGEKKATWSYKTEYNGSPLTVKYAGSIDAQNKMTGTVTVEEYSVEGDFTATQGK